MTLNWEELMDTKDSTSQTYIKNLQTHLKCMLDDFELGRDDRQHWHVNAIEFIKATPSTTLAQTRKDLSHSLRCVLLVHKKKKQHKIEFQMSEKIIISRQSIQIKDSVIFFINHIINTLQLLRIYIYIYNNFKEKFWF